MTDDLISRQAVMDMIDLRITHLRKHPEFRRKNADIDLYGLKPLIEGLPSAEPVRHGKWIDMDEQSYTWKVRCSVCGHERSMLSTQGEYPNYCENCGARMDEE